MRIREARVWSSSPVGWRWWWWDYVVELVDVREKLREVDGVLGEYESVWELDRRVEVLGGGGEGGGASGASMDLP